MTEWPRTYARIVDAVGAKAAIKLIERYGGQPVYLPMNIPERHAIAELIGYMNTAALIDEFGYGTLVVPMGVQEGHREKRRQIITLLEQHRSHTAIARDLKVHVRTVERVAERMRKPQRDPRQSNMFE